MGFHTSLVDLDAGVTPDTVGAAPYHAAGRLLRGASTVSVNMEG